MKHIINMTTNTIVGQLLSTSQTNKFLVDVIGEEKVRLEIVKA